MLSRGARTILAASILATTLPAPGLAEGYVFRYKHPISATPSNPDRPGEADPGYGIGNDITVYFTGAIGYEFTKLIPVATQDVVEWKRVSGSYQPGLSLDPDTGIISGTATGTTAQRKALLLGYDAAGNAIARADITFRFVNPVGAPQNLVFYGHTGKYMSREIPATAPVARWEPLTPLPPEFQTDARLLNGTPAGTYNTGVAFVGYDYMDKEVAFTAGDLIVQDGPTFDPIANQHRHPSIQFLASARLQHTVGEPNYRLIALDGMPPSLSFNPIAGLLKGYIPTFNTSLRFQIEATEYDGTKGLSNVFTFSTYAPDIDISNISDMHGTAGKPFAVRLAGRDLSGDMNWQVIAGELPEGLSLDPQTGEISGVPAKEEVREGIIISVSTSDSGYGETKPFSFTIHHEEVGVSFQGRDIRINESFTTSGPTLGNGVLEPYAFRVAEGASLHPSLTVDESSATVSGSLATAGSYDVPFTFTNGDGRESTFNQPIQAYNPLALSYDDDVTVYRRVPADVHPTVPENSIIGAASFLVESGTLPPGLTLERETGRIEGSATAEGTSEGLTIRVTDASGDSAASNRFTVEVKDRPDVEVVLQNTDVQRYAYNYVSVATAENVFDGVVFELVQGNLPVGLNLTRDGHIVGSTTDLEGTYGGLKIRATDGEGYVGETPVFSIKVGPPHALQVRDDVTRWTVGVPFSLELPKPSNAFGTVTYRIDDLPPGVYISGDRLVGTIGEIGLYRLPFSLKDEGIRDLSGEFALEILDPMTATLSGSSAQVSAFSFMRMAAASRFDLPRGSDTSIAPVIENGIEPISYTFGGSLPDGLTYADGRISGVPTTENQSKSMSLTVADAAGTSVTLPATLATVRRLNIDLSYDFASPAYLNSGSTLPRKPVAKNVIGDVTYEVTAGVLPPGMRLEPKTGYITGAPTQDGRFPGVVVTATDSEGAEFSGSHGPFEIGVSRTGEVGLAPLSFLTVRADRQFLHTIRVTNVTAPLVFGSASDDGALPPGLSLGTSDGSLSGTLPLGRYSADIRVTDDFGRSRATTMHITAVGPLAIAAPATKSFNQYASVNVKPAVTNPVGATRYELVAGTLPEGLKLDPSTGAITGTPTVVGTASGLVIRLTDATGDTVQTPAFNIAITNRLPLTISTGSSYPVFANMYFRFTVPITNAVGEVTLEQKGTLPPGISFDASKGIFAGSATNIGSFPVTVTATDSAGGTATKTFTLSVSVNDRPIALNVTNFVTKVGHTIATAKPTWSNHVGDIRFWADDSLAQNGLKIDPMTGVITGTATELIDFTPNIHITDASGRVTSKPIRIQVIPNMVINAPARIEMTVNSSLSFQMFSADNAIGAVTWSKEGAFPASLIFHSTVQAIYGSTAEMGTFHFRIRAQDSIGDVAYFPVELVVKNNGLPPTVSFSPSAGGYRATGAATLTVGHGNKKIGDTLTLAPGSSPLPPGMTIEANASGQWSIRKVAVSESDAGVYRGISLRMTDAEGLFSDTVPAAIVLTPWPALAYPNSTIKSRPDVPVDQPAPLPSSGKAIEDVTFSFQKDVTGGKLKIDAQTGAITGFFTDSGVNTVLVRESYDGITIRTFTYQVDLVTTPLSIGRDTQVLAFEGVSLETRMPTLRNTRASGVFSLEGSPPDWLEVDRINGALKGTPSATGVFDGTVVVYQDEYGRHEAPVTIKVVGDDPDGYRFWRIDARTWSYADVRLHDLELLDATGFPLMASARISGLDDVFDTDHTSFHRVSYDQFETAVLEFPARVWADSAVLHRWIKAYDILGMNIYGSNDGTTWNDIGLNYRSSLKFGGQKCVISIISAPTENCIADPILPN